MLLRNTRMCVCARVGGKQAPTDDWQYGDRLQLSVIAKNFLGQRVPSCDADVRGSLARPHSPAAMSAATAAALPAIVKCDQSSGSAVYVLIVEGEVLDGAWVMSAEMDGHPVLHRCADASARPLRLRVEAWL